MQQASGWPSGEREKERRKGAQGRVGSSQITRKCLLVQNKQGRDWEQGLRRGCCRYLLQLFGV